jgi:hypothetical protein
MNTNPNKKAKPAQGNKTLKKILWLTVIFLAATSAFAVAYGFLTKFNSTNGLSHSRTLDWFDYYYFSIVTASTLGFGEIIPVGISRALASCEVIFGLIFVGYSLSQVLSARQEYLIEYLALDRMLQTYNECLTLIDDAKEVIGDRRRLLSMKTFDSNDFVLNRGNPFYPALKAMQTLNGYTDHLEKIGRANTLSDHIERAAHHVEELANFVRKYISILTQEKIGWATERTEEIVTELCDLIDKFSNDYVAYTRYASEKYKNGGLYVDIVQTATARTRAKLIEAKRGVAVS